MSESLNYLLGNFVTQNFDVPDATIQESNMVCVDTSNGFLGFNTIDPSYNIDICNGTIRTGNLILNNLQEGSANLLQYNIYYDASGFLKIKLPQT
jgi:hypothetical protein